MPVTTWAAAVIALTSALTNPVSASAQRDASAATPPVSADRVREGLQRPEPLRIPPIPEPAAHFRVDVEGLFPVETVLDGVRRDLAAQPGFAAGRPTGPGSPLAGGLDLLGVVRGLAGRIGGARRARAERNARREVQDALAAFCRVHDCSVLEEGPPPHEGLALPPPAVPQ